MSFKTADDYHSYISSPYTPSPYFYCYINSEESFQSPISFEETFPTSTEQIQSKQTPKSYIHRKKHRHNGNITTKQSYRLTYSNETIPTLYDDHVIKQMHRSDSRKSVKHNRLVKQESFAFQRRENIDDNQQLMFSPTIDEYSWILRNQSATISREELTNKLNQLTYILKTLNNNYHHQQQLHILIDVLDALIGVHPSMLASVSQHEFFSILQITFIDILRQWRRLSSLPDDQSFMFYLMAKLLTIVINNIDSINLLPPWLMDSILLEAIADCLTDIASSGKFLDHQNKRQFKHFTRLVDTYIDYQQRLTDEDHSNKNTFIKLLHPVLHCLTSSHFIDTFTNMSVDTKSMTTIQKFFLIKCSAFIISYNGSRLEQTMESLLSTMLPRYVTILNKLVPSANRWNQSMIRSMQYLLKTINHGANQFPTNAKLVSSHLPLIDRVLKLLDEPIFYNNLRETLSNPETSFVHTAISFLVNMINEAEILAHIKQSQAARVFLRLTSCAYEPLVLNVYLLLAYTTHEEDIKAMHNPGRLLATIIESLKTILYQKPGKRTQIEQLFETLKGLVQHDQLKDEIIKQNALPFLLECSNNLSGRALVLTLEILWCLTFIEEIARALRANSDFLEKIQTISEDKSNEPLRKAADGLVWKLIKEPAFLEKVVKQEDEQEKAPDEVFTTTEVVIAADGTEQLVKKTRRISTTPSERSYQYDIMISYCHADKELTYKIHKFLIDQGFKVWIDLDSMYGPAMSAMAAAVENSEFVIMCMSDAYKQSTYCQAEAEYAFKCKRRLIPLVMRQGYKPDGWLGFMIGSRMYIDFGRYVFEVGCEKILTEISLQRRQTIPTILIDPLENGNTTQTPQISSVDVPEKKKPSAERHPKRASVSKDIISSVVKARQSKLELTQKPIHQWTEADVLNFLMANRLNQIIPLCEAMNGRVFMQFYKICTSNILRGYSVLKDELKSSNHMKLSLSVYSRFLSTMEDTINSPPIPPESKSIVQPPAIGYAPMLTTSIPFVQASDLNMPYDFIITSDASPFDTLKMVEKYSAQLEYLDSLRRRITNVY